MSYTNLLIWQYRNKPKAYTTIKVFSDLFKEVQYVIAQFPLVFNVDEAIGYHLDVIGRIVGVSRVVNGYKYRALFGFTKSKQALGFSVSGLGGGRWWRDGFPLTDDVYLEDPEYRWLIWSKIYRNNQRGDIPYLAETCGKLLGEGIVIVDNYDMTVTITIPERLVNEFKKFALINLDVLPRPQGVKYNIRFIKLDDMYFGFEGAKQAEAFNVGKFYNLRLEKLKFNIDTQGRG